MARGSPLPDTGAMDESPEEMEQIRREADAIDPYQYRRRRRTMAAIALGALGAGLVWVVLELVDRRRNPCQRIRDHYCEKGTVTPDCVNQTTIFKESVEDPNPSMRSLIRQGCLTKINRLATEQGIKVR
jgi:hypothetical protein